MTDEIEKIVTRAQSGDMGAFGQLYIHFKPTVIRCLLRDGFNLHTAEDICHDIFLNISSKMWQLRSPCLFPSWLRTATKRAGINFFIRVKRPKQLPDNMELPNSKDASHIATQNENSFLLNLAVENMRPMDKASLRSFYWQGNSILQMSEIFQAPVGTIKRRLHVARNRLRAMLKEIDDHDQKIG